MPLGKSPVGLVLLTLIVGLVATAMGMLVAALAKTPKQADNVGLVLGFVLAGIAGCMGGGGSEPITRSEGFMAVLSRFTPHAHAIEAYYRLMAENGSFADILPQLGILVGMAVVFFVVAMWRFRFE
jgi:ABC-2 type transport system permease protein